MNDLPDDLGHPRPHRIRVGLWLGIIIGGVLLAIDVGMLTYAILLYV